MSNLWKRELKTGLLQLDNQNQEILALMEEYFELCKDDSNNKEIFSIVKTLDRLVHQHFQEEEVIQVVFRYNLYDHHKQCHQKLKMLIVALQKLLVRFPPTSEVIKKSNDILYKGFCSHILKEDKTLARYVTIKKTMANSDYVESA